MADRKANAVARRQRLKAAGRCTACGGQDWRTLKGMCRCTPCEKIHTWQDQGGGPVPDFLIRARERVRAGLGEMTPPGEQEPLGAPQAPVAGPAVPGGYWSPGTASRAAGPLPGA